MSTKAQAIKRRRQNAKKRLRNLSAKNRIKTEIKKARISLISKNTDAEQLRLTQSLLDKAAGKGIIHKRQAARRKSRLARAANSIKTE